MVRYLNGGESRGTCLLAVLEGAPSGLSLTADRVNHEWVSQPNGYKPGGRMRVEEDWAQCACMTRKGATIGKSIGLPIVGGDSLAATKETFQAYLKEC